MEVAESTPTRCSSSPTACARSTRPPRSCSARGGRPRPPRRQPRPLARGAGARRRPGRPPGGRARRRRRRRPADDGPRRRQGPGEARRGARGGRAGPPGRAGLSRSNRSIARGEGARTRLRLGADRRGRLRPDRHRRPPARGRRARRARRRPRARRSSWRSAEEVERIVVGLPVTLRGEHGLQAEETERFVERAPGGRRPSRRELRRALHDARSPARPGETRAAEDAVAAAHLLTSYLQWKAERPPRVRTRRTGEGAAAAGSRRCSVSSSASRSSRRSPGRSSASASSAGATRPPPTSTGAVDTAPPKPILRIVFPEGFTRKEMAARIARREQDRARRSAASSPSLVPKAYLAATRDAGRARRTSRTPTRRTSRASSSRRRTTSREDTTSKQLVADQLEAFERAWSEVDLDVRELEEPDAVRRAHHRVDDREGGAGPEGARARRRGHLQPAASGACRSGSTRRSATGSTSRRRRRSSRASSTTTTRTTRASASGLPPTPISNPGLASMQAAAHPADVDYLYFVRKPDCKSHFFTASHAEFADYSRAGTAVLSGTTTLVGLLGHPLWHSLSPRMQNAAFEAAGLDWAYVPLGVEPERLEEAVAGPRRARLRRCERHHPAQDRRARLLRRARRRRASARARSTRSSSATGACSGRARTGSRSPTRSRPRARACSSSAPAGRRRRSRPRSSTPGAPRCGLRPGPPERAHALAAPAAEPRARAGRRGRTAPGHRPRGDADLVLNATPVRDELLRRPRRRPPGRRPRLPARRRRDGAGRGRARGGLRARRRRPRRARRTGRRVVRALDRDRRPRRGHARAVRSLSP